MLTRFHRDERGFVLIVVLLSLSFVMVLVTSVMNYGLGSQNISRRDQDWNAALAAAEAGIDDYLLRLNQDGAYWQYGDPGVAPSDTRYGPAPTDGNLAFSTWVPVPGAPSGASFRYDRDKTPITVDGSLTLISTGRVRNVTRTIQTTLRRRNFLDYLYFTDYETKDPAIYVQPPDGYLPTEAGAPGNRCNKYYYGAVDARRDIGTAVRTDFAGDTDGPVCTEISFASSDVINGPLHSNDAIRMNGTPTFNGPTTTSYDGSLNGGQRWWGSATPTFAIAGDPRYADPLTMPPTNVALKNETDPAFGGTGCLFTGPTAIRLNTDGTMDVISPFSQVINCSVAPAPDSTLYYTEAAGAAYTVTRMQLPPNGVIYVQNVPTSGTNGTAAGVCPTRPRFGGGAPDVSHPLGFPQLYDVTPAANYGCRNGDVFLMGALDGRLTIAADNNIVVVGDTTYEDPAHDLLGLIANNYIEIYHPARTDGLTTDCDGPYAGSAGATGCSLARPTSSTGAPSLYSDTGFGTSTTMATSTAGGTAFRNAVVKAAILTVQHSFRVQNYQYGATAVTGTLNVTGAIAQKYRGIVGLIATTGYAKNYVYDQRLRYDSPPKFLNPVAAAWQVVIWAEKPRAYAP